MDRKVVLVTGGCGYIGSHIVKKLSESGEKVVVYDNLYAGDSSALLNNEDLVKGDILDRQKLDEVFTDYQVDSVIHLAALVNAAESVTMPERYFQVNTEGSVNVFESAVAHGVKKLLFASSAAVYGNPGLSTPIPESTPLAPSNPYGESKSKVETWLNKLDDTLQVGIFRFFNVAGADKGGYLRQSTSSRAILQRLFAAAHENGVIKINGSDYPTADGTVIRDFIHVSDIAEAIYLSLKHLRQEKSSFTVNLGSGTSTSMKKLAKLVKTITGRDISIEYNPRTPGDIMYSLADISLAKTVLNWNPSHNIADMVKDGWKAYEQKL